MRLKISAWAVVWAVWGVVWGVWGAWGATANAQALTDIYGDGVLSSPAWGTSGTANAANTGFNTLTSSGALNFVGAPASDLWPGAAAPSYIEGQANTSITVRIDPASGANGLFTATPTDGAVGTYGMWVRAVPTDPDLASYTFGNPTAPGGNIFPFYDSGGASPTGQATLCYVWKGRSPRHNSGLVLVPTVLAGTSVEHSVHRTGFYLRTANGAISASGYSISGFEPNVPLNRWVYLARSIKLGNPSTGYVAVFVNGQKVSEQTKTGFLLTDASANNCSFTLPALPGIKWQIGEANSHRGTGHRNIDAKIPPVANHTMTTHWPVTWASATPDEGEMWQTATTGTATVAVRASGHFFFSDRRENVVVGMEASSTFTMTSTRDYGLPDYSAEGWFWVWFPDWLKAAGLTSALELKTTGGSSIAKINIGADGTITATQGSATIPLGMLGGPANTTATFSVGIALNSDGRVHALVLDNTTNNLSLSATNARRKASIVASAPLNHWDGGSTQLGDIVVTASASARTAFQVSGCGFFRYLPLAALDSYSEGPHDQVKLKYVTWTSETGSPTIAANTVITHSATSVAGTVVAGNLAARWALIGTAGAAWPGDGTNNATTSTGTGSPTLVGISAGGAVQLVGVTVTSGTFQRGETVTGGTSGATARLCASGALDSTLIELNRMVLGNASGVFRAGETITGGTSGATATLDVPILSRDQACTLNGDSLTQTYSVMQDAHAASSLTFFSPADPNQLALTFAGTIGRAGRVGQEARQGAGGLGNAPSVLVYVFGGVANSVSRATTLAAALEEGREAADGVIGLAAMVVENDGRFVWEEPAFLTGGGFLTPFARRCFDEYVARCRTGLAGINQKGRIQLASPGNPSTTDGVHYDAAGANTAAGNARDTRVTPTPGGGLRGRP
jgi:hypothetical protein